MAVKCSEEKNNNNNSEGFINIAQAKLKLCLKKLKEIADLPLGFTKAPPSTEIINSNEQEPIISDGMTSSEIQPLEVIEVPEKFRHSNRRSRKSQGDFNVAKKYLSTGWRRKRKGPSMPVMILTLAVLSNYIPPVHCSSAQDICQAIVPFEKSTLVIRNETTLKGYILKETVFCPKQEEIGNNYYVCLRNETSVEIFGSVEANSTCPAFFVEYGNGTSITKRIQLKRKVTLVDKYITTPVPVRNLMDSIPPNAIDAVTAPKHSKRHRFGLIAALVIFVLAVICIWIWTKCGSSEQSSSTFLFITRWMGGNLKL